LLKYSSMPSMKIASGALTARRRGTRWPSVSVAQRCSSLGVKSSRRTKWSMTLCRRVSAIRLPRRASTLRSSRASKCFRVASAIADSHTFDHGSGEAENRATDSRPKILSPIGLSSRLPCGRQTAWPSRCRSTRLALRSSVLPKPLVPMTTNLSSRPGVRKASISGVRWSSDSSKSSATRMSSASTVHARIATSSGALDAARIGPTRGERPAARSAGESLHVRPAPRDLDRRLRLDRRHGAARRAAGRPRPGVAARRRAARGDIAVVVNDDDPASVEVGRYYADKRGIAEGRIVHVRFPPGQAVMRFADFLRVQAVLEAGVGADVQAYALAWTLPYRVECMSVTAAFALGFDPGAYCADGCHATRPSPYFDSASRTPWTDHRLRPAMLLAGVDVEGAKRLIDRGVRSDERWPEGKAYLMNTSDGSRNVRAQAYEQVRATLGAAYPIEQVDADALEGRTDVMFEFTGVARVASLAANRFVDGAIADHLTSFGGILASAGTRRARSTGWPRARPAATARAASRATFARSFPRSAS
jgi:uncharacterized protein (TIGR03790 family)